MYVESRYVPRISIPLYIFPLNTYMCAIKFDLNDEIDKNTKKKKSCAINRNFSFASRRNVNLHEIKFRIPTWNYATFLEYRVIQWLIIEHVSRTRVPTAINQQRQRSFHPIYKSVEPSDAWIFVPCSCVSIKKLLARWPEMRTRHRKRTFRASSPPLFQNIWPRPKQFERWMTKKFYLTFWNLKCTLFFFFARLLFNFILFSVGFSWQSKVCYLTTFQKIL